MNITSELSCCLFLYCLLLSGRSEEMSTTFAAPARMMEICDNGLDDDQDGRIDAFDPDCQCEGRLSPNLVPNGQFNQTTGCCADLGQVNCLADWIVLGPSPDYISDNCSDNNLRPDVRFLANAFNQGAANDGYIFSVVQMVDGRQFTESMGVCLDSPMEAGKTYQVSFDLANLRNDAPDLLFSLVGIDLCDRLVAYDTRGNNSFCELQLPVTRLGTVNARDLTQGWNTLTFEVIPEQDIEAIFYTVDCEFTPGAGNAQLYMVMDEVAIREQIDPPIVPSIMLSGEPCQEVLSLRIPFQTGVSYQWYRDSIPIIGATDTLLLLTEESAISSSVYQVLISDIEGNCDLTSPFELTLPELNTQVIENICAGEVFEFAGNLLDTAGIYLDTLDSSWGCDSIVELHLEVWDNSFESLLQTLCAGDSVVFAGVARSATGQYQDTLVNVFGCDSIVNLDLIVLAEIRSNISESICRGDQLVFSGQVLSEAGLYQDTLPSVSGCDSIITLELGIQEPSQGDTLFVEQPLGTSYSFLGTSYSTAGIYQAALTGINGCDSTTYLSLSFYDPCSLPLVITAESGAASCASAANGQIEIFVEGAFPPFTFHLDDQPIQEDPVFIGLAPGSYTIMVQDTFNCQQSISIDVPAANNMLNLDLGPDTTIFLGEQIDLEPLSINFSPTELVWSSDLGGIDCQICSFLSVSPLESTQYRLEATDEWGCSAIDEIRIKVIPPPSFYIPNAFSPNDDGINDVFRLESTDEAMDRIEGMKIYSRWGDLLFEADRRDQGKPPSWDGGVKGKEAELGVYVYTIFWRDFRGRLQLLTGDVLLVR